MELCLGVGFWPSRVVFVVSRVYLGYCVCYVLWLRVCFKNVASAVPVGKKL